MKINYTNSDLSMEQLSVSVVIPVRNCQQYIHEAVDSVITQDFVYFEIIIIDDGSDDFDYDQLTHLDRRIQVHHLTGVGVSRARNFGMQLARGKYIAFLDADDIWFPGKLSAQVRYFEKHPDVGCVFGGFLKWLPDETGAFPSANSLMEDCADLVRCEKMRSGWIYTRLLAGLLVGMNTAVIRREVYENLGGFDETMRIGEDYLFWLKVARVYEMHALDGKVALYRIHSASAMHRLDIDDHQSELLALAVKRWGLCNPDGSHLSQHDFQQRVGACVFDHGYKHFWDGATKNCSTIIFKIYQVQLQTLPIGNVYGLAIYSCAS